MAGKSKSPPLSRASSSTTLSCVNVQRVDSAASTSPKPSETDASSVSKETTKSDTDAGPPRRVMRARQSLPGIYNENRLSAATKLRQSAATSRRAISGETLVEGAHSSDLLQESIRRLDMEWKMEEASAESAALKQKPSATSLQSQGTQRRSNRIGLVQTATEGILGKISSLGKRGRETIESGKENAQALAQGLKRHATRGPAPDKPTSTAEGPSKKRVKISDTAKDEVASAPAPAPSRRKAKRWMVKGLYAGQERTFDPRLTEAKNKLKAAEAAKAKSDGASESRSMIPLPMFLGQRLLETGRDFKLPFDVFSPLPPGQPKPEEWRKTRKNVFVGDAASFWKNNKLEELSKCLCSPATGCDEDCQNRIMFYECDDSNCNTGAEICTNRSFEELRKRCKAGGKYNVGVEVMKTDGKGYGVRSNRSFAPNQVIVEYTGEIITQEECEERMNKQYKKNECYYLMLFDQNMIIDATRGSIARFVNHSCEPNCKMVKWTVGGKPRMALFAGENGVMTGEELTYDYNFDPYSIKNVQECRCGSANCRGVLGPKPKEVREPLSNIVGKSQGSKRKAQEELHDDGTSNSKATKKRKIAVSRSAIKKSIKKARDTTMAVKRRASSASTLQEKKKGMIATRITSRVIVSPVAKRTLQTSISRWTVAPKDASRGAIKGVSQSKAKASIKKSASITAAAVDSMRSRLAGSVRGSRGLASGRPARQLRRLQGGESTIRITSHDDDAI